jgi:Transposase DDE domain
MAQRKARTNRDHAHQKQRPDASDAVIAQQLEALLTPAIDAQASHYRRLGLRERILTLPLMVAAVLTLLWRDVPGVGELTRMLAREDLLWCRAINVTQQSLSQRFLEFPAELFERVFFEVLPQLKARWIERHNRPLPVSIQKAQESFEQIWIADGSTLEKLFRKLGSLQVVENAPLGGKILTIIDLVTRLPIQIWFCENPKRSDAKFESDILALLAPKTLLLLDRGFYHFQFFADLIARQVHFITRLKAKAHFEVERVCSTSYAHKDQVISLGTKRKNAPQVRLRLIQIRFGEVWYSYLTSVLDPEVLPPFVVADLYRQRWRIEEAFSTVKRLLGLSYLWTGSINGIKLQLWGTWLFFAVLVDLGDAVANELGLPFERISLEMLYRGLYHFGVARNKGVASDPVTYFAASENQDLDVVKTLRKPLARLDLSPFPSGGLTFCSSA